MGIVDTAGSLMRGSMDIANPVGAGLKMGTKIATGDMEGAKQQIKDGLGAALLIGGAAATLATGGAAAPAVVGGEAALGGAAVVGGEAAAVGAGEVAASTAGQIGMRQVAGQLGKGVAKQVAKSYAKDAARNLLDSGNGHTSNQGYAPASPPQSTMGGPVQPQGPSFQDVTQGVGGVLGGAVNAAQPRTTGWGANDGS